MTNIPLFCTICPKSPEFSDISHLLTHVASKSHLSHKENTKIRALQDVSVRERLAAYEKWYEVHHIAKLLSERMIAKDSKDSSDKRRKHGLNARPGPPTKESKQSKRRTKKTRQDAQQSSPIKTERCIDPQLSRISQRDEFHKGFSPLAKHLPYEDKQSQADVSLPVATTPLQDRISPFRSEHHHYSHKAHIPRMSKWQDICSPPHTSHSNAIGNSNNRLSHTEQDDADFESDYMRAFLRSPTRTTYPDPSEVTGLRSGITIGSSPPAFQRESLDPVDEGPTSNNQASKEESTTVQSPVLRGVKWPGMSIFDSASLDAQRLRNQKKDDKVVEYMEHNASMVEQLERIYWPDGSLKMERLITGNVESSPSREPSPPPRPSKRQRTRLDKLTLKSILRDLSTNIPKATRRSRTCKGSDRAPATRASDLQDISHKTLATLDPSKLVYSRSRQRSHGAKEEEEEMELQITSGISKKEAKRDFDVYRDHNDSPVDTKYNDTARKVNSTIYHGHQRSQTEHTSGSSSHRNTLLSPMPLHATSQGKIPSQAAAWESKLQSFTKESRSSFLDEDSENIEPIYNVDGRIHDVATGPSHGRITQRYFSVTGGQPPQFFSSLPPGMDFGSHVQPQYLSTTLNPPNSYFRQQRLSPHAIQPAFSPQAHYFPLGHNTHSDRR